MTRKRVAVLAVTTLVLAAVMTTATWALSRTHGPRPGTMMSGRANSATVRGTGFMSGTGMMGGSGMMGGYGVAGNGRRVGSLDGARARAQVFAERLGLRVGEVMQFTNGFYAEIVKVGRTSVTVAVEVYSERQGLEAQVVKVTEATLTYVATDAQRHSRPLPPQ